MSQSSKHRVLAPLASKATPSSDPPSLAGIIFDVDGTLCDALGIPKSVDILEHISSLPESEQPGAHQAIEAIEKRAMAVQKPTAGLDELMTYLERQGVRKAICTRNFELPINHLLTTFLPTATFAPILTRKFTPPKPHPAGILEICRQWGLEGADRVLMVGDSPDDFRAAAAAGCFATVMVRHVYNAGCEERDDVQVAIERLDELVPMLESGFTVDSKDG